MKRISAGQGAARYTLYLPVRFHQLALPIDMRQLAGNLSAKLGVDVAATQGEGWEQLRIGPFDSEAGAKEAFLKSTRYLATLCVDRLYPLFFHMEQQPLDQSGAEVLIDGDGRRIDAFAFLYMPCIVPEHQNVWDSGAFVGQWHPQMTDEQLADTLGKAAAIAEPLQGRLAVAIQTYIAAAAIPFWTAQYVGFVTCLEALCEEEPLPSAQLQALSDIGEAIESAKLREMGGAHAAMVDSVIMHIKKQRTISIQNQIKNLVKSHEISIAEHLGSSHPWSKNLAAGAKKMYYIRSRIVHDGTWGIPDEDVSQAREFAIAVVKGVLLDKLANIAP
ncbi:hypothetical protein [Dyella subtropica]|uniref:hypothetical protein n=1 Tax=Dyella subtropica TaxID=2992127 RepID=UPI00224F33AC|nr:hypothetical protein [Dyella subtropica]